VIVKYVHRMEDFEDACRAADRSVPRFRRIRIASVIAGALLIVAPFLAGAGILHPDKFLLGMEPIAFCFLVCGLQSPRGRARKIYAAAVTDKEYEATITEDGIATASPLARGEFEWAAFQKVLEGETTVALISDAMMYVFPNRAFSAEQLQEFKKLISNHVPASDGKAKQIGLL
jgi:hypothetical protein